jgi:hypothetical protein
MAIADTVIQRYDKPTIESLSPAEIHEQQSNFGASARCI